MAIAYTKAEIQHLILTKFFIDTRKYPDLFDVWVDGPDDAPCPGCGAPWYDVLSIDGWREGREAEFHVNATCCDIIGGAIGSGYHLDWERLIADTKIGKFVGEEFGGRQVYHEDEDSLWGGSVCSLDFGLTVEKWTPDCELRQKDIKDFISSNHRHNAAPVQWKWAHLIWNGPDLIAVVWTGRPVARRIDHSTTVEVNRLCIDHSLNRALTWKASSVGYKASALEAKSRGYKSIITYTLAEAESGLSLRYARWKKDGPPSKGGSWNRAGRPREDKAPTVPKQRWIKRLDT